MHKDKQIDSDEESTFEFQDDGPSKLVEEVVEPVKATSTLASFFGFGLVQTDSKKSLLQSELYKELKNHYEGLVNK